MGKPVVAVFTFFSRTTCGHCKHFKGETTDLQGRSKIDPNSGWEVLTSDRELQDMGVEFQLYQFGPEKDPETGVVKNYALDEEYAKRVKGIPHLEMAVPDDPHNYIQFNDPELRGWEAKDSVPVIKRWIIRTLQQEPFKSWRPKAKVARPPEAILPNRATQPLVPAHQHQPQSTHQVKTNFQPTPTQQALIDRHMRQPAVTRQAAPVARPTFGQNSAAVVKQAQIVKASEPEEEDEVDSLQEEEVNSQDSSSEKEEDEKDEASGVEGEQDPDIEVDPRDEHLSEEEPKQKIERQPRAIPVQARRAPVRRQMPVKTPQRVQAAPVRTPQPTATTTKGLATQRVQTPSPRPVIHAQPPVPVQAAVPVVQAQPVQQSKPKFLPANWDV